MNPEDKLLQQLNNVLQYSKQSIALKIKNLISESKVDLSNEDAARLVRELDFELENVYKNVAPRFADIRDSIRELRKEAVQVKKKTRTK